MVPKIGDKNKSWFVKSVMGIALLLIGIVIGVVAVLAYIILSQPSREEIEASIVQESIKYITTEQQRLGIDCNAFNATIQDFLEKEIKPVLKTHQPGRNWYKDISEDARTRMNKYVSNFTSCEMLYSDAKRVKWDGLKGFGLTVGLRTSLMVLNILIRHEWCDEHDAKCLDQKFYDLRDVVRKIDAHLIQNHGQATHNEAVVTKPLKN